MRRSSLVRFLTVPVAAAGAAALIAAAAPSAFAATGSDAIVDSNGSVSITVPASYVVQLAKAGVIAFPTPLSDLSFDNSTSNVTVTFQSSGGDADVSVFYGTLNLTGNLQVAGYQGHVTLSNLGLDVANADIEGTPSGSSTPVALLDLRGNSSSFSGTLPTYNETYDSSALEVDPAGAAYLNSALHSTAFQAGQQVGTLAASWTVTNTQ
jgi:hypothetical protein